MQQVQSIVSRYGGTTAAARALGVERSVLHRFCKKGAALDRTRNLLRTGLARIQTAPDDALFVHIDGAGPAPSVEALIAARRIFGSIIELIDGHINQVKGGGHYGAQLQGGKDDHGDG
jgi:hypothetical protein